ncbi:hypothetical protein ACGFZH_28275 [Streptomyces zaomyceticus]|uniref:hypothetical protein n=1 Tax=Streptomyces zaomyceticus TaxID=68286 RepID=UPI00371039E9
MESTLMNYEGPATIDGTDVPMLRLRVVTEYDDGVVFPDEPVELLRGWTAEAAFETEPRVAWAWGNVEGGVEVKVPNRARSGRALMTGMDVLYDGGWTVYFTGVGMPPMPED